MIWNLSHLWALSQGQYNKTGKYSFPQKKKGLIIPRNKVFYRISPRTEWQNGLQEYISVWDAEADGVMRLLFFFSCGPEFCNCNEKWMFSTKLCSKGTFLWWLVKKKNKKKATVLFVAWFHLLCSKFSMCGRMGIAVAVTRSPAP